MQFILIDAVTKYYLLIIAIIVFLVNRYLKQWPKIITIILKDKNHGNVAVNGAVSCKTSSLIGLVQYSGRQNPILIRKWCPYSDRVQVFIYDTQDNLISNLDIPINVSQKSFTKVMIIDRSTNESQ